MKKYNSSFTNKLTVALLGLWLVIPIQTHAQKYRTNQEVAFTIGGLAAMLDYDIPNADIKNGQGLNLGFEYTHYLTTNFGVSLGLEYQHLSATVRTDNFSEAYITADYEQENFEFRYTMSQLTEKQKINFVSIPIMFVYQNEAYGFYIRGGAKIGIPIISKFKANYNLSTSGYYPQYNAELFDPQFMGFGNFENMQVERNAIDTKLSYIATVEMGIKQPIGKGTIYGGIYFDYGLNDMSKKNSHPVIYNTNNSGVDFKYNSLLNSSAITDLKTKAFGIKLRYSFWSF